MIISRTAFQLIFGKARDAIAIWKEIMDFSKEGAGPQSMRLLTDMSGENYTLVGDVHYRSMTELGPSSHVWMTAPKIRELYPRFVPLCRSSRSELYRIEHQVGTSLGAGAMVEQMTFRLKYGQAKEACAIWREILDHAKTHTMHMRLLTDITGPSYTLIVEMHHRGLMDFGPHMHMWYTEEKLRELYGRFLPLCESSERTLFKIEHEV